MGKLDNRVAIVTGADSGIRVAITRRFTQEGATVIAIARRKEKLQTFVDEVTTRGGKVMALSGDFSEEEDFQNAVRTSVERFGHLDIVVNNAGMLDRWPRAAICTMPTW